MALHTPTPSPFAPDSSGPILILGGSHQARRVVEGLDTSIPVIYSLAGTTDGIRSALPDHVTTRRGGFGGIDGLMAFLRDQQVRAVLDATHPYAATMHANAIAAATATGIPYLRLERPGYTFPDDVDLTRVPTLHDAVTVIRQRGYRRILVTTGRTHLWPWRGLGQEICIVLRSIDPADVAGIDCVETITAKGPFSLEDEIALVGSCDVVITRDSGGDGAKITAAQHTGTPVIVWERPPLPPCAQVASVEAAIAWVGQIVAGGGADRPDHPRVHGGALFP